MKKTLVEIKNLKTHFCTKSGLIRAVDDVSFKIKSGETVGIVGESGCGKSITALSLMRLIPTPSGKIVDGKIIFNHKDILEMTKKELQNIRGNEISMIFQEPMASLNPTLTIGSQISEAIMLHLKLTSGIAKSKTIEMLNLVGIPRAEEIFSCYPHELSGGMLQRVMIAMALSCNPKLIIADEPTTALDVTIQAQILDLMKDIKEKFNTSLLLITHDFGVVAEMCDYVIVMYAGKIIEETNVFDLFENPLHPYTQLLLKSKPSINSESIKRLYSISGQVPNPINLPEYCYFYDRCPNATDDCKKGIPPLERVSPLHKVACFKYNKEEI